MEYEIRDHGEDALMDESTNPSLAGENLSPAPHPAKGPNAVPVEKRTDQKAEDIPEEEEQPS